MRFVSYRDGGRTLGGVLVEKRVTALAAATDRMTGLRQPISSVRGFLTAFGTDLPRALDRLGAVIDSGDVASTPLSDLQLSAPVPNPSKVICVGLNYVSHVGETGRALPTHPDLFAKFDTSLIGPTDEIHGREISPNLDFEGELAIVIGRRARHVHEDEALAHVAGAMILNDISARDLQWRGTQWLAGKAIDGSTPTGPSLVTLDEIPDLQDLTIVTRVNGVEMQRGSTAQQIFSVAHVVADLSTIMTLSPGDVIATGTPDGIGGKRNPPVWLDGGDVVEVEITGLGVLENRVA